MNITVTTDYIRGEAGTVYKGRYMNSEIALVIKDSDLGEVLCTATVNLEQYGEHPAEGNVFIKDWSENAGILRCLIDQKVISEPVRLVRAGFVFAFECELIGDPKELE